MAIPNAWPNWVPKLLLALVVTNLSDRHQIFATAHGIKAFEAGREKYEVAMASIDRIGSRRKENRDETASNDSYGDVLNDLLLTIAINGTTLTRAPFPAPALPPPTHSPTTESPEDSSLMSFPTSPPMQLVPTTIIAKDDDFAPSQEDSTDAPSTLSAVNTKLTPLPTFSPSFQPSSKHEIEISYLPTGASTKTTISSSTFGPSGSSTATTAIPTALSSIPTYLPTEYISSSSPLDLPTSFPPMTSPLPTNISPAVIDRSTTPPSTLFPTYYPTRKYYEADNGLQNEESDTLQIDLPRIICNISTLSSDVSEDLQQKHILLLAMTNTIFELIERGLPMFELLGVALAVSITKIQDKGNESFRRSLEESTIHINAEFEGSASFSTSGAPSQDKLVRLLLENFDITAFSNRLKSPLRQRNRESSTTSSMLQLNAVYFILPDGSLVEANAKTSVMDSMLPTTRPANDVGTTQPLQVTVVFIGLVGMAFVLAVIMLVIHTNREFGEEENEVNDEENNSAISIELSHEDSFTDSPTKCVQVDLEHHRVEIHIPKTPQISNPRTQDASPRDDLVSINLSEVSSLSGSPIQNIDIGSKPLSSFGITTSPGLGIPPPNYRYQRGGPMPYYIGSDVGFDDEEWRSSYLSDALETP